jgi:hypothetical protein
MTSIPCMLLWFNHDKPNIYAFYPAMLSSACVVIFPLQVDVDLIYFLWFAMLYALDVVRFVT